MLNDMFNIIFVGKSYILIRRLTRDKHISSLT